MNIQFQLKDPTKDKSLINLIMYNKSFAGGRFKMSTQKHIQPLLWDNELQLPITLVKTGDADKKKLIKKTIKQLNVGTIEKNELQSLNAHLERIKTTIRTTIANHEEQGIELTKQRLKEKLVTSHRTENRNLKKNDLNYMDCFWQKFIEDAKEGKRTIKDSTKRYEPGTIKTYIGSLVQFQEFQKKARKRFTFKEFGYDEYQNLLQFFNKKDYTIDSTGKHIARIKALFKLAKIDGIEVNVDVERFKAMKAKEIINVTLAKEEVQKLYELNNLTEVEEKVRDVFLVGVYTAQRYSDYSRIKPHNIKNESGQENLELIQKKTGKRITIPLNPNCQAILKRYKNTLPKTVEQTVNKTIKQLCKRIDATENIIIERIKGGRKVKEVKPKFEMVHTHTARRTGATLMYKAKIPILVIMKFTGHTKESNFLKYINLDAKTVAEAVSQNEFFK